mmetsp:Transcript_9807/g.28490  ORF Transcript_9807/g.28490 Transcript_9807/m.28490 type:complete len:218 (-) Transcript_9807:243-896(-)
MATPPRSALACFLRRFFSPGSHKWQNRQSAPFRQPSLPTNAQGLQRPRLWPMDPMLGAAVVAAGLALAATGARMAGGEGMAAAGVPGCERPGGGPVAMAAATALRRASASTPPGAVAVFEEDDADDAAPPTEPLGVVSVPTVTPAGVAAGVGAGVDSSEEPADVAEPPDGCASSAPSSESSAVEHSDSASTSSSTVGKLPFGVTVHRPMPRTARRRR